MILTPYIKKKIHKKLELIAQQDGTSVEEVRRELELMIHACMNSSNAIVRAYFESIPCQGKVPTVEEAIAHGAFLTMQKLEQ